MKGKRKSKPCENCDHHPTKRVYVKVNNVFRGVAWLCLKCNGFTRDEDWPF